MMFCPSCGVEQSDEASYCSECGAELSASPKEFESSEATNGGTATASDPAGGTDQSVATQPTTTTEGATADVSSTGWAISRKVAIAAAAVSAVSVFLPWIEAATGGISVNGMSTEIGPIVLVAGLVGLVPALLSWGRGWGWLSMIVTGLAGVGAAGISFLTMAMTAETATLARMEINGQMVPMASVQPTVGVYVAIGAGALLTLAALGGIVGSLTGS